MSEKLEKLLEELLEEQERTSLYTMTLERARLFSSLLEAGIGTIVITANEFTLAPGATQTIVQLVPPGFVYMIGGPAVFYTSLPWWVSYSMWLDQTPPALPIATATRMPDRLTLDTHGIIPIRVFMVHTCVNLDVANPAFALVYNVMFMVSTETWDMIRQVYLDALVKEIRKKALKISGIPR